VLSPKLLQKLLRITDNYAGHYVTCILIQVSNIFIWWHNAEMIQQSKTF